MFRLILIILLASTFIGILGRDAAAQEQLITRSTFEAGLRRYSRPPEEWRGKARRFTRLTTSPTGTLYQVWEYDTLGSSRLVWDSKSNGQHLRQQDVTVGLISYKKVGDAKWTWKEKDPQLRPSHNAPFESELPNSSFTVEYEPRSEFEFRLGVAQHKGSEVLVYTRVKSSRHRAGEIGTLAVNITVTTKYWIGADGRTVRFEQWDNHRTESSATTQFTWSEWELDPSIVIRPPIVEP